jgi:hypothetical protein
MTPIAVWHPLQGFASSLQRVLLAHADPSLNGISVISALKLLHLLQNLLLHLPVLLLHLLQLLQLLRQCSELLVQQVSGLQVSSHSGQTDFGAECTRLLNFFKLGKARASWFTSVDGQVQPLDVALGKPPSSSDEGT